MWEAIVVLAKTPAAVVLVAGLIGLLFYMVKKGMLSFKGKGVTVGDSKDRLLIRNQWEYANSACEAQFAKIIKYCKSNEEAKYLIARVEDVFQSAIIYNYMTEDEAYLRAKQALVLQTIQKRTTDEHFFSDEFRACCNRFTENLIKDLVRMKRIYM